MESAENSSNAKEMNEHHLANESFDIDCLNILCEKLPKHITQLLIPTIRQLFSSINNIQQNIYKPIIYNSLQTLINRCTQPQINYFNYLNKGNNLNPYPVFGVIAWNDIEKKCPIINWGLCSWVESAGVRLVPIVEPQHITLQNETMTKIQTSIKQQLANIHGLIIPSLGYNNKNSNKQNSIKFLQMILKLIKQLEPQREINILSFGRLSLEILLKSYSNDQQNGNKLFVKSTLKATKQFNFNNNKGKIVSLQKDTLFQSIDCVVQLKYLLTQVEFSFTEQQLPSIDWSILQQHKNTLEIQSFLLAKNNNNNKINHKTQSYQLLPYFLKQQLTKNTVIYHCLLDIYTTDKLQLFNKLIINFVDLTKRKQYKVKNPTKYVAHYPLQFKDQPNKAYYKIVTNNNK